MCGHKPKLKYRNSPLLVHESHSDKHTCYRKETTMLTCSLEEISWSCQLWSFLLYIAQNCPQTCLQGVGDGTGRCPCEKETCILTVKPNQTSLWFTVGRRPSAIPFTLQDSLNHPLQMTSSRIGPQSLSKSQLLEPIPQGEANTKPASTSSSDLPAPAGR